MPALWLVAPLWFRGSSCGPPRRSVRLP